VVYPACIITGNALGTSCGLNDGFIEINGWPNPGTLIISGPVGGGTYNNVTLPYFMTNLPPGVYSFSFIDDATGCSSNELNFTIFTSFPPNLVVTDPPPACSPNTVDITIPSVTAGSSGGALSYFFDPGATNPIPDPTSLGAGTYYIELSSGPGCSSIEPVVVTIIPPPTLVITDPQAVCSPGQVDLTDPAITAGSSGGTLNYYTDPSATNPVGTPTAVGTGAYYIVLNDSGCTDTASVNVVVNPQPVVNVTNTGPVCANETFVVSESGGDALNWNWSSDMSAVITNTNDQTPQVTGASNGETFTVSITDANGCFNSGQTTATIWPLPTEGNLSGGGVYCEGDVVYDILLSGMSGTPNWIVYYTFDGSPMDTQGSDPINLGNAPGVYQLDSIIDGNGCANIAAGTQTIVINSVPPQPVAGVDTTYCEDENIVSMSANGTGGTITWYADSTLTIVLGTGQLLDPNFNIGTTSYYVTETINGCESPYSAISIVIIDCDTVNPVVVIPTAFTPDGDQTNEYWNIQNLDLVYPNNKVYVYNRWGSLLYESDKGNYDGRPWYGLTPNKEKLPVASYFYIIDLTEDGGEKQNGTVSIIRNE
jgi:gliding motility-associated-like protein